MLSKYASNLIVAGSLTPMMLSVLLIKIQMDTLLLKMSVPSFLIMIYTSPQKKYSIFSEDLIKDLMEKYAMESFSQNLLQNVLFRYLKLYRRIVLQ